MPPDAPIYDAFAYLAFLAARTERVRLGTHVFNIGLRHPFTTARGVQTRRPACRTAGSSSASARRGSKRSGTRRSSTSRRAAGASTRRSRSASGCGPRRRSRTTASSSRSTRWCSSRSRCRSRGRRSSSAASRRPRCAARRALGDGWIGMAHTLESAAAQIATLRCAARRVRARAVEPFQIVLGGPVASRRRRAPLGGRSASPA